MADKRVEWTVNLYRYNLGENRGELYPCVELKNTINLEGVINTIVAERSELRKETLRSVAYQLIHKMQELLIDGHAVSTPLGTLTPTVKGMWNGNRLSPSARAENTASLNYTMSLELKEAFSNPLFKLGRTPVSGPRIYSFKNLNTGEKNEALTPGCYVMVQGRHLLMNGDLPERGLYLLNRETGEQAAYFPPNSFMLNSRSQIMIQLPKDIPAGEYTLQVLSQCTTSPRPLKAVASGEWQGPVFVKENI
ncbi:MAG: DUF4469 domain-containing protein [Parabacteroides sp.]|nr:DUF4469 domain-containing protein [Parabacteroides sp.]